MKDSVIIDTCIWASFFAKPHSLEKRAVDALLDAHRVVVTGPILTEVLLGFRRQEQADWVASRMRMAHRAKVIWDDWCQAGSWGKQMAATRKGRFTNPAGTTNRVKVEFSIASYFTASAHPSRTP